jgi:hypothetical protein
LYANWYYTASGLHGNVPCNNPMERHNGALKGSSNFDGVVQIGIDMHTCLTKEFVTLVDEVSMVLTSPTFWIPVLDFRRAMNDNLFLDFQSVLDPEVDIRAYNGGWLINDVKYLTEEITVDHVEKMEWALAGIIEEQAGAGVQEDIRDILLKRTRRFHVVKQVVMSGGTGDMQYFECDCTDYYFHRLCYPAASMQHEDELRLLGKKIIPNALDLIQNTRNH